MRASPTEHAAEHADRGAALSFAETKALEERRIRRAREDAFRAKYAAALEAKRAKHALLDETGAMRYSSGAIYSGDCAPSGVMHGTGEFVRPDGYSLYEGSWHDGGMSGKGIYYFSDGSKYAGDFKHNMLHGRGTLAPAPTAGRSKAVGTRDVVFRKNARVCYWDELVHGQRIRVELQKGVWREGTVSRWVPERKKHEVKMDFGPLRLLDLAVEKFELLRGNGDGSAFTGLLWPPSLCA